MAPPTAATTAATTTTSTGPAQPTEPRYYARVSIPDELGADAFAPLRKTGGIYVAELQAPLLVQTPPLQLVSPLDDADGEPLPTAHLKVPARFAQFAQGVEDAVLSASLANKEAWFRRPLGDEALRASLKRFAAADTLKVRLPRDILVFDAEGALVPRDSVAPESSVRCLLELSRVCFGRTEFGAMWSVAQAQVTPPPPPPPPAPPAPPRCMIDATAASDDEDEAGSGEEEAGSQQEEWVDGPEDVHEFS